MPKRIPLVVLLALLILTGSATAQMQWGLTAWSAGLGLVAPENIDSAFWLAGGAEFARVNENVTLDGRLMWWSSSNGDGSATADFSDIAILPGATYYFTSQQSFTPFARAGLGIHRFKSEVNVNLGSFGSGSASATSTELGVYLGGGAAFQAGEKVEVLGVAEFHLMDATFFVIGAEVRVPVGN